MRRLLSILFWSVLSAAFIGPGTVTVASMAGAQTGAALLWALLFSTAACVVLQEASARVAVASGQDLGRAIRRRFSGRVAPAFVALAIGGGCAAYEMGNILGGARGIRFLVDLEPWVVTLAMGAAAAALLWRGSTRQVARALGAVVAVMGFAFLAAAVLMRPDPAELLRGLVVPTVPAGSGLLVAALVGTTVVPYNLFLGSGLAAGRDLREVRFGIAVAVGLGGLISMGVLVAGTAVRGEYALDAVATALGDRLGSGASTLFAVGLFAAGLSSAITAPLAAAITVRSLYAPVERGADDRSPLFRATWGLVLGTGVVLGCLDLAPEPAIVLAQAANGILLPLVAVFLLFVVNDRRIVGEARNGAAANGMMVAVVAVTLFLGGRNVWAAWEKAARLFGG